MSEYTITPEFISFAEAARLLGVSVDTIERRVLDKTLVAYKIAGRARRVRVADVRALAQPINVDGYAHPVAR